MSPPSHEAVREGAAVRAYDLEDAGNIPNHPRFPLLLYRSVLELPAGGAATVENVLAANGWGSTGRDGIYSYHHYHSTAHEVLGIVRGEVEVLFGGEPGERPAADEAILATPLPGTDPILGEGPMQTHWTPGSSG